MGYGKKMGFCPVELPRTAPRPGWHLRPASVMIPGAWPERRERALAEIRVRIAKAKEKARSQSEN